MEQLPYLFGQFPLRCLLNEQDSPGLMAALLLGNSLAASWCLVDGIGGPDWFFLFLVHLEPCGLD